MDDIFKITRRLIGVKVDKSHFDGFDDAVHATRFGCVGCPAIGADRTAPRGPVALYGRHHPLNELYDVWFEARRFENRMWKVGKRLPGPIKMAVRQTLFTRVMDIQDRAGVVLVTSEDEAFIRQCWADKTYPRGWSEADEATESNEDKPLFAESQS